MKIAIPVDEKDKGASVCVSFGRAPYFFIYDTETKESSFIENSAAKNTGGAGVKAAQIIIDSKADALLTPRCGENAAEAIEAADIKIYKTQSMNAEENIDNFMNDKLSLLDEIHAGFHGHGGN
ncbi:MAG: NifB/NifX family molybdenum-iron cluster-binding protein [Peptostreptococcales bacterium]